MTGSRDPIEGMIRAALTRHEIRFIEGDKNAAKLDFYLPDDDLYIEVKQFHSDRISGQMARASNVIAIQGVAAARWFADLIEWSRNGGSNPPEAAT